MWEPQSNTAHNPQPLPPGGARPGPDVRPTKPALNSRLQNTLYIRWISCFSAEFHNFLGTCAAARAAQPRATCNVEQNIYSSPVARIHQNATSFSLSILDLLPTSTTLAVSLGMVYTRTTPIGDTKAAHTPFFLKVFYVFSLRSCEALCSCWPGTFLCPKRKVFTYT